MKYSLKILSLILSAVLALTFAGCAKKGEDEKKPADTGTKTGETEIVTDENGETVYVEADDTTEFDIDEGNGEGNKPTGDAGEDTVTADTKKTENGGKKDNSGKETKTEETTVIYIPAETEKRNPDEAKMPAGVTFGEVSMSSLEGHVNLELEIVNTNAQEVLVDLSYLILKLNDKTEISHMFGQTPVAADGVTQCALSIDDPEVDLPMGSSVTVYYGNTRLGEATVLPF